MTLSLLFLKRRSKFWKQRELAQLQEGKLIPPKISKLIFGFKLRQITVLIQILCLWVVAESQSNKEVIIG